MRSVTRAVRVVALTLALGTVSATSGAGAASAWWGNIQFSSERERVTMVSGVGIPDDVGVPVSPRFGDLNPGYRGISSNSLPDRLRSLAEVSIQASSDSRFDPVVESPKNPVAVRPESATAAKTAATAKPGPSRTTNSRVR